MRETVALTLNTITFGLIWSFLIKKLKFIWMLFLSVGVLAAQTPDVVIPIKAGNVTISLSYVDLSGKTITTNIKLVVNPPEIVFIQPINALNPARWSDTVATGKKFCVAAWAIDAQGKAVTGKPISWSTNDSTIATMVRSPACPDTTIDPAKMATFPVPPLSK